MERPLISLRDALELAMKGPGDRRYVVVDRVHISQAAVLLAFLRFENERGRWEVRNAARLASLVSIDGLLRALSTDLLPRLVADPASAPAWLLLSRYARYIMASASAAGGTFAQGVTGVCEYFIECADAATRRPLLLTGPQMRRRAKEMLRRLHDLRSRNVSITDEDPRPDHDDDDSGGEDEFMALDLHLTSLRQALQEVTDAPAADRRVFVDTVRASHSLALLGVVEFQAMACNWTARNIGRLRAVTTVAGCCETIVLGLLRVLITEPTNRHALTILEDFTKYAREKVGKVGGEFTEHATRVCDKLNKHGATARRRPLLPFPSLLMKSKAQRIRQYLGVFTSRDLSIAVDSGSDTDTSISSSD